MESCVRAGFQPVFSKAVFISLAVQDLSCFRGPLNISDFSLDLKIALALLDTNALLKITEKWVKEPVPALDISKPASRLATAKHCFTHGHPAPKFHLYMYLEESFDSFVLSLLL